MKKINFENLPSTNTPVSAENLNLMQSNMEEASVVVSSTEPTTEEKVWFKKGKNLFNIKNITLPVTLLDDTSFKSNGVSGTLFDYDFKENTQYTISGYMQHAQSGWGQYIRINYTDGTNEGIAYEGTDKRFLKVTTPSNKTISNITLGYSTYAIVTTISELQIEEGTEATAYEPYIDKEIYVKNANGVFEKFYNETEKEIYSAVEQKIGTWIDGKPLYRKVIDCGKLLNAALKTIPHNIANIENIVTIKGFFTTGETFLPMPYVQETAMANMVRLYANKESIFIGTGNDRTAYNAYVTLEYTKQ